MDFSAEADKPSASSLADQPSFEDNAEVLMQMSQGESLSQMLSEGIWISKNHAAPPVASSAAHRQEQKKRSRTPFPASSASSINVPNSFDDMVRELRSQPLQPPALKPKPFSQLALPESVHEVDSFGLFFYSSPKSVQISRLAKEAFNPAETIILRSKLSPGTVLSDASQVTTSPSHHPHSPAQLNLSYDNLKALVDCLPSTSKSGNPAWIIPFTVTEDKCIDLRQPALLSTTDTSFPHALFNYYSQRVRETANLPENDIVHQIVIEDTMTCAISAPSPHFNLAFKFRGAAHAEPVSEAVSSIFSSDANYNIQIDPIAGSVLALQMYIPKFDAQARMFTLLKALCSRLSALAPASYYLVHAANTPILRIVSDNAAVHSAKPVFDLQKFCLESIRK